MAHYVIDEVFGKIEWSESRWESATAISYFRGSGERLGLSPAARASLGPGDQFPLKIAVGEVRRRPDELQRVAWRKVSDRGDALWEEAVDALVAEYLRQRPVRVRYWNVVNSPKLLERAMPAEADRSTMRQMIVPQWCTLEWPDAEHRTVDLFLVLLVTWFNEPINVYVRDGRVTEIVPMGYFMNRRMPWIDTEAFGTLRRDPDDPSPWSGEIELGPFRLFAAVAVDRSTWDEQHGRSADRSDLPFDVAHGWAELFVHGPANTPPSERQSTTFRQFIRDLESVAARVIQAIFAYYREVSGARRAAYRGPHPELAVPALDDAGGLRDVTELKRVNVFPEEDAKQVAIGFIFRGSWTGSDGIGVRWRDGKVEQVGHPDVANPTRYVAAGR